MTLFAYDESFVRHAAPSEHPECPERLDSILDGLVRSGLRDRLTLLEPRSASDEELRLAHSGTHVTRVREAAARAPVFLDPDTYMNEHSLEAALRAAGAVLEACRSVSEGEHRTAFCAVRPPGHHATRDRAMGFCLFNNVAVAARWLDRRVLIVDWDVHHGNGTQDIFQEDARVFYVSTHRFPFYPGTGRGEETGCGNIINIPLAGGTPSGVLLERLGSALKRAVAELRPEFALISCGFDAYRADPIGGLGLSPEDFGTLTRLVRDSVGRDTPVVSALEGGYALDALGACATAHVRALLD